MAGPTFLADTSVFARLTKPAVAAAFAPLAAQGQVAICAPVIFEIGFSAQNLADHEVASDLLTAFPRVPVSNADHQRALEVQALLAERGQHRALSLVDALVAATAEGRDLTVLHYDADFDLVAQVTGQSHQWIVARGTTD